MITQDAFITGQFLLDTILRKMEGLTKKRSEFIIDILLLILGMRGRINFLQMSRQGQRNEKTYRNHFERLFDWFQFNKLLVKSHCSEELIIGFDPSFIKKSGKHTPGLGFYYSGCSGSYTRGMEIGSFAVIDVKQNTAYHLHAETTPSANKQKLKTGYTLVDHYITVFKKIRERLSQISKVLVVDGYFAKKKYVDGICESGDMELISRLRDDANLRYIYKGKKKSGRGRPKLYDGKVDTKNIDKRRLTKEHTDQQMTIYSAIVYSVGLKRKIKLCYVVFQISKKKEVYKLFFSTNLKRKAPQILQYYKSRYQMEFIFRDAKQFTGLQHCQSRSENKLKFHFNASMSAISVAKIIIRSKEKKNNPKSLSIVDLKTEIQNRNMLKRIFSIYGFDHKLIKIDQAYRNVLDYGKIAA